MIVSRAVDYLEIFNVTKGKCTEQKKHAFIFEESFSNNVQDMIKKHDDMLSKKDSYEKDLYKMVNEITDLENKLKCTKDKRDNLIEDIKKAGIYTENILQEFENTTGDKRIEIWK